MKPRTVNGDNRKYFNRLFLTIAILALLFSNANAQKPANNDNNGSFFKQNSYNRIYLGHLTSYTHDNIGIMSIGYDYGLKLLNIKPDYNLIDFGFGADLILGFDEKYDANRDRPYYARIVPGFEINWSMRLYLFPVRSIKSRIYLEGMGMTFVYYAKPYPDNGTNINIGSHVGVGIDYQINQGLKGFFSLRLAHTSNGKEYSHNPALNAIGLIAGLQF